jgi:FAD/FMN-containing dehydrogenase
MTGTSCEQGLKTLEKTFKDRLMRSSGEPEAKSGALASVLALHAQEVGLLAREAERYSMPLAAVGGGTSPEPVAEERRLLVRFDLMCGVRLPHGDMGWVEAEPGTPWLTLDEELLLTGMGLAVYPTSAPALQSGAGWPQTGWEWVPSSWAGFGKTTCRPAWCCLAASAARCRVRR